MKPKSKRIIYIIAGVTAVTGMLAFGAHRYHHDSEHHAQWMMERVSNKLDLTTDQQARLKGVRDILVASAKSVNVERTKVHQEVLEIIKDAKLDRQKALAMVTQRTDKVRERAPSVVSAIGDFYDSLTPEQRAEVRDQIKDHAPHQRRFW